MKKLLTAMALTIFATTANAAINTIAIEELMQKPLQLSEKQINRISVKDGIVSSIIANPSKFNIQIDETLGQAFVTLFEAIEEPEGFTVITDSGYTQDFLVTSALGEPIITYLTEPVEKEGLFRQVLDFRGFYDIYHGRSLEGFIKRILRRDESLEVGELLPYIQDVTVYSGDFEEIYVITLRNHSRRAVPVDFSGFSHANWFFSPVDELKPKETSKVIISKARH